jgi:hypothetical protein
VTLGLAVAVLGYAPVPLFNTTTGPSAVVNVADVMRALSEGAALLRSQALANDGSPAFLLDDRRMKGVASPRQYDNRWLVLPQHLPSAGMLLRSGIRAAVVVQERDGQPADDLRHALRRWQEQGVSIMLTRPDARSRPAEIEIAKPRHYRALWQRVLVTLGLRRNSAGGFGAIVPDPSSSGGGFH